MRSKLAGWRPPARRSNRLGPRGGSAPLRPPTFSTHPRKWRLKKSQNQAFDASGVLAGYTQVASILRIARACGGNTARSRVDAMTQWRYTCGDVGREVYLAKTRLNTRLSGEVDRAARMLAAYQGVSYTAFVEEAVKTYLMEWVMLAKEVETVEEASKLAAAIVVVLRGQDDVGP